MIKCYFDGCCEPTNPYGHMGIGAIILKDNQPIFTHSEHIWKSELNSNNVAEYLALEQILTWLSKNPVEENQIFIYGDSKLVINQMNKKWKIKFGLYKPHAIRCKAIAQSLSIINKKLVFNWIGRDFNQMADDLSKAHLLKNKVEFKIQPQ